jgi:hypothetical protein
LPNNVLRVETTELLSPDLPNGTYEVFENNVAKGKTFSIKPHRTNPVLKEIMLDSCYANLPIVVPAKLLFGLNIEKMEVWARKWSNFSVRIKIWQNIGHIAEHMAKVYKRAPNNDWKQYGPELFDQAVLETVRDEEFGSGFRYIKEVYGGSHYLEIKRPFLYAKHTMKDQLTFKAAYGRFMYPEENLEAPKTIQLFKESMKIVVGSLFRVPGTEQKILVFKDEENLRVLVPSRSGIRSYWSTSGCHKPLENTFLAHLPAALALKCLYLGMDVFESLFKVEGDFQNEKKISVLNNFCARNNLYSAKIEYLTVRTKHSEQDPNVPLFRNIPVVVLKSPGNKRYWYKKGDLSYLLTTGTLPNSLQKAKALLEQQNKDWTTNLTTKELER